MIDLYGLAIRFAGLLLGTEDVARAEHVVQLALGRDSRDACALVLAALGRDSRDTCAGLPRVR